MDVHDLDVLVLGRPAEVAFATGAVQLWTAGSRPFGPACVAVRATGRTHLLSVSDDGVPEELSHDDLYGLSWNPAHLAASLAAIPGVATARRVGTASSTPGFPRLVQAIAPGAEVVDGSAAIWAARAPKTPDEIASITTAVAIAESALAAMIDALRPGASERDLVAAYLDHIASLGAPTPPTEGVACATARAGPVQRRHVASSRPIEEGALVALDAGAFVDGYEGGVGRTRVAGGAVTDAHRALAGRCRAALDATISVCRAGATGSDLVAAWSATGEPLPPTPLVTGIGLGLELPIVGVGVGLDAMLSPDTVLAVSGWIADEGVGGFLERDLVLVTEGPPRVLNTCAHGPSSDGA
jgi:Xaa-Pro dipeptidase